MENKLSPIILFVYNRPEHTRKTLEALSRNALAAYSDLIIFADGPKENADKDQITNINKTRNMCKSINGFKSLTIHESESNKGLAQNIISGVTSVLNKYGKAIVLEDDIVVCTSFLEYMNQSLNLYADEKKVWQISSWMYPFTSEETNKCGFQQVMNCWGWGTWLDRWEQINFDPQYFIEKFNKNMIKKFSFDYKADFWLQMLLNKQKVYKTWAIFFYATIFEKNGLCLAPYKSLATNIGFDNTGEHSSKNTTFETEVNENKITIFPDKIELDSFLNKHIEDFIKCNSCVSLKIKYLLCYMHIYAPLRKFAKTIKRLY